MTMNARGGRRARARAPSTRAAIAAAAMLTLGGCFLTTDSGDKVNKVGGGGAVDSGKPLCSPGSENHITTHFRCKCVDVTSCKDLSNVVLEVTDGTHFKLDGLSGIDGTFCADMPLVGVWVKSGNNRSGDGPGYGERFDAPGDTCEPEPCPNGTLKNGYGQCPPAPCDEAVLKSGRGC